MSLALKAKPSHANWATKQLLEIQSWGKVSYFLRAVVASSRSDPDCCGTNAQKHNQICSQLQWGQGKLHFSAPASPLCPKEFNLAEGSCCYSPVGSLLVSGKPLIFSQNSLILQH